ncbi:M56 family metallopeptidase [Gimesia sp.]|uniref:M56 family metallopeptidase n=1 Tax=Gimesia sp. TaxID=2024833 RepID=UPI0032ED63A1
MNGFHEFLNHPLVTHWGAVLLHFVWQGAALALLAWVVLWICQRQSAQLRYLLATGCLFLMLLCPVITWLNLGEHIQRETPATGAQSTTNAAPFAHVPEVGTTSTDRLLQGAESPAASRAPSSTDAKPFPPNEPGLFQVSALVNTLPWLVAVWACGVVILSLRMIGGWLIVRNHVSNGRPLRDAWTARVNQLADLVELTRAIRWIESSVVQVPQALGWVKPVILLPASLFTTLTPAEIECLLLHELLHLRRHDFLVNLLQCLIETLFFYHPGVYWLSRRIRLERELACDAAVVALTADKLTFSRALLSLAEQAQLPSPALAATGSDLTIRIHALLGLKRAGSGSGIALWICLALCMFSLGLVSRSNVALQQVEKSPVVESVHSHDAAPSIERFVTDGVPVPDLSGKVLDSAGKPVAGATVYLRQSMRARSGRGIPRPWQDLARTTTDAQGKFRFVDVLYVEQDRVFAPVDLVALKDGYALGWKHVLTTRPVTNIRLTLEKPTAATGRVIDEAGQPVAHAEVRLKHLMSLRHITQADLEQGRWPSGKDRQFVALDGFRDAPVATTDATGRFELKGLVAERGLCLQVSHPEYLLHDLYAATVPQLAPEMEALSKRPVQTGEIAVTLEPGYRLRLRVVDDETGILIPGVRYIPDQQSYQVPPRQHDQDGVIEIMHLKQTQFLATVYPPEHTAYLAYSNLFTWPAETRLLEVEIRLPKGIPVRGRVINEATGAGVPDAPVAWNLQQSQFIPETPHLHPPHVVTTDADGYFLVHCPSGEFAFQTRGRIRGFQFNSSQPQPAKRVSVSQKGPDSQPVIELQPAPRIQLIIKDPQGQPVPGADIRTAATSTRSVQLMDGSVIQSFIPIHGVSDARGEYRLDQLFMTDFSDQEKQLHEVVIRNADDTLGAQLLVQRPPQNAPLEQPIEVQLQQLGFVEGRTVHEPTGAPIAGTRIVLYRKQQGDRDTYTAVGELTTTAADGSFRLKGVLPGLEHYLSLSHTRYKTPNGIHLRFQTTSGNTHDFGQISLGDLNSPSSEAE